MSQLKSGDDRLIVKGKVIDGRGNAPFTGFVAIEGGQIAGVFADRDGEASAWPRRSEFSHARVLNVDDAYIAPGLIDIHIHGSMDADVMDGSTDNLLRMIRYCLSNGTTSILATTLTADKPDIDRALDAAYEVKQSGGIGQVVTGVHLEGPFISRKWPGAQHQRWICNPQPEWLRDWTARYPGLIRMLTLAPELEGAEEAIAYSLQHGIVAACGHSDATYEEVRTAIGWGVSHAVHCCNAMRPFHHREPGVVGAVLLHDELSTEMNLDGYHLHPAAAGLIMKNKRDQVCLITDAMRAAGMPDGRYHLGGLEVLVNDGAARFPDGTIAGSTIPLVQSVRNLANRHGMPIAEAVKHATSIPAHIAKLERKGVLEAGYDADLIVLDPDRLQVERVMLGGSWFDLGSGGHE